MEKAFYSDGGDYYNRCLDYAKAIKVNRLTAEKFMQEHNIAINDYAYDTYGNLYIKAKNNEKYKEISCKELMQHRDIEYFKLKHTSKLYKEFSAVYKTMEHIHKPTILLDLFPDNLYGCDISYTRFFYENKLYINISIDKSDLNTPKDFTEIKLSDYYKLVEDLKDKNYEGVTVV